MIQATGAGHVVVKTGSESEQFELSASVDTLIFTVEVGPEGGPTGSRLEFSGETLVIHGMRVRRCMSNPFDSQFVFYVEQLMGFHEDLPRLGTAHTADGKPH